MLSLECATLLAHKLGAYHHLPHGIANALLITDVMRFNAAEVPAKMGTFSQYQYPHCKARYVECADFLGISRVKMMMRNLKTSLQGY